MMAGDSELILDEVSMCEALTKWFNRPLRNGPVSQREQRVIAVQAYGKKRNKFRLIMSPTGKWI